MGSTSRRLVQTALSLVMGGTFLAFPASARILRVPAQFSTIQAGLDAAVSGDSILVTAGPYREQLSIHTSHIALLSDGSQTVVESSAPVMVVTSNAVLIAGFKIIAKSYLSGSPALLLDGADVRVESCVMSGGWAGVLVTGQSEIVNSCLCDSETGLQVTGKGGEVTLRGCDILNNRNLGVAGGVSVINGGGATLVDCRLMGNSAAILGGAIYVARESGLTCRLVAERCVIARNAAGSGAALLSIDSDVMLRSCTIVANDAFGGSLGGGVMNLSGDRLRNVQIENCIVAFNKGAALLCRQRLGPRIGCCNIFSNDSNSICGVDAGGNFSLDPLLCNLDGDDFHLESGSPCAPDNAPPGCGLIGALDVRCTSSVSLVTWGVIKQLFMDRAGPKAAKP